MRPIDCHSGRIPASGPSALAPTLALFVGPAPSWLTKPRKSRAGSRPRTQCRRRVERTEKMSTPIANGNGCLDAGEARLPDVVVEAGLKQCVSDARGEIVFHNLPKVWKDRIRAAPAQPFRGEDARPVSLELETVARTAPRDTERNP
jgi:hypothetical protein